MTGPGTFATAFMNLRVLLSYCSFTSPVLEPRLETCHKIPTLVYLLCCSTNLPYKPLAYPGIFSGGSTNSVENRGQIERGSGGGSPLVRGSAQFANG
jgi:hypothetical protein